MILENENSTFIDVVEVIEELDTINAKLDKICRDLIDFELLENGSIGRTFSFIARNLEYVTEEIKEDMLIRIKELESIA